MSFKNRFNLAKDYLVGGRQTSLMPTMVATELTNHCNLDCIMCPHGKMTRGEGIMDFQLFRRIVDEIAGNTELLYLYGLGEALLVKDFFRYAEYATSAGMPTILSTNVTAMTEKKAAALATSGIDFLILAIDGTSKESYEEVRRGGVFEDTLRKAKMVLNEKIKANSKTHITVQLILQDANKNEAGAQRDCFTENELKAINTFRIKPLFETFTGAADIEGKRTPCFFPWNSMTINWNGIVPLCCFDYDESYVVGDASGTSVRDVWNSEKMRQVRFDQRSRDLSGIPICSGCTFPEKGYFSPVNIMASTLINTKTQRRVLPYFEKSVLPKTASAKTPRDGNREFNKNAITKPQGPEQTR